MKISVSKPLEKSVADARVACLPSKKLAIATVAAQGIGTDDAKNFSTTFLVSIADHMASDKALSEGQEYSPPTTKAPTGDGRGLSVVYRAVPKSCVQ